MKLIQSQHPATGDTIFLDVADEENPRVVAYMVQVGTFEIPDQLGERDRFDGLAIDCSNAAEKKALFFDEHNIGLKIHKTLQPGDDEVHLYSPDVTLYLQLLGHYWRPYTARPEQGEVSPTVPRYALVHFDRDAGNMYCVTLKWGGATEPHGIYISPLTALPQLAQDNLLIGVMTYDETIKKIKQVLKEERVKKSLEKIGLVSP